MGELDLWSIALRLAVACACGAVLGWDREVHDHAAGLRTHTLVCLGSALFIIIALEVVNAEGALDSDEVQIDILRVVSGVVGGIGFLGAGAIIQRGGDVKGLTTAAGLWVAAGIGLAAGLGLWKLVALATVFAFCTLTLMKLLKQHASSGDDEA